MDRLAGAVALVDGHHHRLGAFDQQLSQGTVEGSEPGPSVHHQHQDLGLPDGGLGLLENESRHRIPIPGDHASGVDNLELPSAPLGPGNHPVSSHSGLIAHQGAPLPADSVEQGGLADVGASDNGNGGLAHGNRLRKISGFASVYRINRDATPLGLRLQFR